MSVRGRDKCVHCPHRQQIELLPLARVPRLAGPVLKHMHTLWIHRHERDFVARFPSMLFPVSAALEPSARGGSRLCPRLLPTFGLLLFSFTPAFVRAPDEG